MAQVLRILRIGDFKPDSRAEVEAALKQYTQASMALATLLSRDAELSDLERLTIENNLAVVQLNYAVCIRKSNQK